MKLKYDQEVDVLSILLGDGAVQESDESRPGIILDFDDRGSVVGIEILNASQKIRDPMSVEYSIAREPLAGLKSRAD